MTLCGKGCEGASWGHGSTESYQIPTWREGWKNFPRGGNAGASFEGQIEVNQADGRGWAVQALKGLEGLEWSRGVLGQLWAALA